MGIYEKLFKSIYKEELINASDETLMHVKNSIKELRILYKANNPIFEYTKKLRDAYMLCYYVNYTYIVDKIIREEIGSELKNVLDDEISICVYAAGPAPELYASINLLASLNYNKFNSYCLDINTSWESQRDVTINLIKNKRENIQLNNTNIKCNLKESLDSCEGYYREINSKCRLYFMNNCINHLSINDAKSIIYRMKNIKKGSIFTIVDLNYDTVRDVLQIITSNPNLNELGEFLSVHISGDPKCTYLKNNKPSDLVINKIFNKENLLHAKYKTEYYYIIYKKNIN